MWAVKMSGLKEGQDQFNCMRKYDIFYIFLLFCIISNKFCSGNDEFRRVEILIEIKLEKFSTPKKCLKIFHCKLCLPKTFFPFKSSKLVKGKTNSNFIPEFMPSPNFLPPIFYMNVGLSKFLPEKMPYSKPFTSITWNWLSKEKTLKTTLVS